jgi:uncharacterized protein (DUF302 family)
MAFWVLDKLGARISRYRICAIRSGRSPNQTARVLFIICLTDANIRTVIMAYYSSKTLQTSFGDAVEKVTAALLAEGFGVISEIDLHEKIKDKLGIDFKKYRILGACNPAYSYRALQAEDKIGVMLPCNVLVIEQGVNEIEIAAVNPTEAMMAVRNDVVAEVAAKVGEHLKKAMDRL